MGIATVSAAQRPQISGRREAPKKSLDSITNDAFFLSLFSPTNENASPLPDHTRSRCSTIQTNVYPNAQRRKVRPFEGMVRRAVVIVPSEEDYKTRVEAQEKAESKDVPDNAVMEMKGSMWRKKSTHAQCSRPRVERHPFPTYYLFLGGGRLGPSRSCSGKGWVG